MSNVEKNTDIVWVDVETTGLLEHPSEQILELAAFITDKDLNILDKFPSHVVRAGDEALAVMNDWSQEKHVLTGLMEEVDKSSTTLSDLDDKFVNFLESNGLYGDIVLAGNGIAHDLKFIRHNLPRVSEMVSHKIIDVNSFGELIKRWKPNLYRNRPKKQSTHRAEKDIHDSLEEMIYYREILPVLD